MSFVALRSVDISSFGFLWVLGINGFWDPPVPLCFPRRLYGWKILLCDFFMLRNSHALFRLMDLEVALDNE